MRITTERPPWWVRFGWFVALWTAGVVAVTALAGILRWVLHP